MSLTIGVYRETNTGKGVYVTNEEGREITLPAVLVNFRGESWEVTGVSRLPRYGSTGRVVAQPWHGYAVSQFFQQEFFPSVFGLTIRERA